MNLLEIILKTKSFNELSLISSFIDQCEHENPESPISASIESLSFSYLKNYIIHLNFRKKLASLYDDVIFDSISQLQIKLKKRGVYFDDYDSFLSVFKGDVKEYFVDIINLNIKPIVKKDLGNFINSNSQNSYIKYSSDSDVIGFTKTIVSYINENISELKLNLKKHIDILDFSNFKSKPIYSSLKEILSTMYNNNDSSIGAMARIHLFGIAYSKELSNLNTKEKQELVFNATGKSSLLTELTKGISLSEHVSINDIDKIPILIGSKYHEIETERLKSLTNYTNHLNKQAHDNILLNTDNQTEIDIEQNIVKIDSPQYYSQFEKEFKTVISQYKGGIMWNYNNKVNIIGKQALDIYKKHNINLFEVMKVITLSNKYDGSPKSALELVKKTKK